MKVYTCKDYTSENGRTEPIYSVDFLFDGEESINEYLLREKLAIKVRKSDDELNINCCVSQKDIYKSFLFYEKSFIGLFNFKQEDLVYAQLLQIGQTCDVIISFIEDSKLVFETL